MNVHTCSELNKLFVYTAFYCADFFSSGEVKQSEIEESFLRSFELCENKGQVTYAVRCLYITFPWSYNEEGVVFREGVPLPIGWSINLLK